MPFPLLPALITDELTDLTPEILEEYDIRLLMLDFDNTIVPYTTQMGISHSAISISHCSMSGVGTSVV